MTAILAGDVILNARFVERIEIGPETYPGGRVKEDAAGRRKWQVTAHIPDPRATAGERVYVIESGLTQDAARARANFLAELL